MRKLALWYDREAPYGNEHIEADGQQPLCDDDGWEKWSLPIGNGYMGVNVFGRTMTERLQITENSLFNPYELAGSIILLRSISTPAIAKPRRTGGSWI